MYKMLAADDEPIVLDAIRYIIAREYPETIALETARSGREAVEKSEALRPDIAFMDIRMPGINGIEALREIKASNPDTLFVIMSACEEFEFAQEAVSLGVVEYLLKPVVKSRIVKVLDKCIRSIESQRRARKTELELRERFESVQQFLEQGFIHVILFTTGEEEFESYHRIFGLEETSGCMMTIEITDAQRETEDENRIGLSLKGQKLHPFLRETLRSRINCIVGPLILNRIMVYIPCPGGREEYETRIAILQAAGVLRDRLIEKFDASFRIGVGRIHHDLAHMRESHEESLQALSRAGNREIVHIMDVSSEPRRTVRYPYELEKAVVADVTAGETEGALAHFDQLFREVERINDNRASDAATMLFELTTILQRLLWDLGVGDEPIHDRSAKLVKILSVQEMPLLRSMVRDQIAMSAEAVGEHRRQRQNSVITRIRAYIEAHYMQELALEDVSREVNISPNYFSRFFKEETGENFIDYLTKVRMQKARELLDEGMSVKEVSYRVGYGDPNYFSRAFKKAVGVTPTEYRV